MWVLIYGQVCQSDLNGAGRLFIYNMVNELFSLQVDDIILLDVRGNRKVIGQNIEVLKQKLFHKNRRCHLGKPCVINTGTAEI